MYKSMSAKINHFKIPIPTAGECGGRGVDVAVGDMGRLEVGEMRLY